MAIVIAVLALLMAAIAPIMGSYSQFFAKFDNDRRLTELERGFRSAYAENISAIEAAGNGAVLTFPAGTITSSVVDGTKRTCNTNASTLLPVGRYLSTSPSSLYRDGFARPICIFVSAQTTFAYEGATLAYHVVAVVSTGRDGRLGPNTGLLADGTLRTDGDDKGFVVDGRSLAIERFKVTKESVRKVVAAYQAFFQTRYLGNSTRDESIDYFASGAGPLWDVGGAIPSTGGSAVPMTSSSGAYYVGLGLTATDVTDGYGNVLLIDNSSAAVRNPSNAAVNLQSPPYTAQISTVLPGGTTYSLTAVGTY